MGLTFPSASGYIVALATLASASLAYDVRRMRARGLRLPTFGKIGLVVAGLGAVGIIGAQLALWLEARSSPSDAGANIGLGFVWLCSQPLLPIGALIHLCAAPAED